MRKTGKFLAICAIMTGAGLIAAGVGLAMGGMIHGIQIDSNGIQVYAPALEEGNFSDCCK